MNFFTPVGASEEERRATVERGVEALYAAYDRGETADVAFLQGESVPASTVCLRPNDDIGSNAAHVPVQNNEKPATQNFTNADDPIKSLDTEEGSPADCEGVTVDSDIVSCQDCGYTPCIFVKYGGNLVEWDQWAHGSLAVTERPDTYTRRTTVYSQLIWNISVSPVGEAFSLELPVCCAQGINDMIPYGDARDVNLRE